MEMEDNPRLKQQVELTRSLDYAYQATLDELSYTTFKLQRAEAELAVLRASDEGSSTTGSNFETPPKKRRTGDKTKYLAQFKPAP